MTSIKNLEFDQLAAVLGYDPSQLLDEFVNLVRARVALLMRAADFASDEQAKGYLAGLLARNPSPEELALSKRARRRLRLSEEERVDLERKQFSRCRLCGRFLEEAASPHVDHIRPIAQGGEDSLANLQLLCSKCNLGKGDLTSWFLGVPYQSQDRDNRRLRYVVLARAEGACSETNCEIDSRTGELMLISRVPLSLGGRWIYDNLRVVCSSHADNLHRSREKATRKEVFGQTAQVKKIIS